MFLLAVLQNIVHINEILYQVLIKVSYKHPPK